MSVVTLNLRDSWAREWLLLELQGVLSPVDASTSFDGLALGNIAPRPGGNGRLTLHVGASRVDGTEEQLPRPLIVVSPAADGSLRVSAVIRRRLVFLERLQPQRS